MPKMKAGTLKPAIDELKQTLTAKGEALSAAQARGMRHRLRRMQRKARKIHALDARRAGAPAKTAETAGGEQPAAAE